MGRIRQEARCLGQGDIAVNAYDFHLFTPSPRRRSGSRQD